MKGKGSLLIDVCLTGKSCEHIDRVYLKLTHTQTLLFTQVDESHFHT